MNARHLTLEQKDLLSDIIGSPVAYAMLAELEHQARSMQEDVLKFALTDALSEAEFIRKRLRADGAATLLARMKARLTPSKTPGKKA